MADEENDDEFEASWKFALKVRRKFPQHRADALLLVVRGNEQKQAVR